MDESGTLLTTRQLQDLLQLDRITIYRMLNDGRLQGFKIGGQWRFSRHAIEQWLQAQHVDLDAAEPPGTTAGQHPSPEELPLSCIAAIQDIFAQALDVGTLTTAVDGQPLTPVANSCAFCDLILSTKAGRRRCISSWRAAAAKDGHTPQIATCHAGLRYVWGRIEVEGKFVAATHAGQFLDAQPTGQEWSTKLTELASATGITRQRLRQALDNVHLLEEGRLEQVPRLLQRVAATFSEIGEERFKLLGRLHRIAEMTNYP
jgi:excisionase family DNA binding protein